MLLASISFKGGVGKSTIAQNCAVVLAYLGYSTVIVDADESRITKQWTEDRERKGITPIIPVVSETKEATIIDTIRKLYKKYEIVIIDCPPSYQPISTQIMFIATTLLIPVTPTSKAEVRTVRDFIKRYMSIAEERDEKARAFLVINKLEPRVNIHRSIVKVLMELVNEFPVKMLKSQLHKRSAYGEAASLGQSVFEYDNEKARKEVTAMVGEVIKDM